MVADDGMKGTARSVLFADLVGSTSLAERLDPEDFRQLAGGAVSLVVAAVDAAGGDVIEIAGDGVLAIFEAPAPAVSAARAACFRVAEHARALASIQGVDVKVRVGVATGEVRILQVDLVNRTVRRAVGDTVLRATALEASAPPGHVQVDEATRHELGLPSPVVAPLLAPGAPANVGGNLPELREERRTIYAVFVGLVASDDDEDADAALALAASPVAAVVERYGGTIKDAAGASVVAMFGAPVAHDDDAERALRASLDCVAAAEATGARARVGVASGLVVVGGVGAGRHVEYGASGDAMNTAARVHAAAAPGEVLATRDVQLRATQLSWDEPRQLQLKGKSHPIEVHPLRGPVGDPETSSPAVGPVDLLLGREEQHRVLHDALRDVTAGRSHTVLLDGPAGIGKTALLAALQQTPEAAQCRWLVVRGRPWSRDERFRTLSDVSGFDVGGDRDRVSERFVEWVAAAAQVQPLVLVIEDLHAVDLGSIEAFGHLAEARLRCSLVVATTRDDDRRDAWLARLRDQAEKVSPVPLDSRTAQDLLDRLIGAATLPHRLEQQLIETAAGNPGFLRALVGSLVDQGRLISTTTGWHALPGPVDVPDTVERVVLARADMLDPSLREVLVAAAILRSGFEATLIDEMLGLRDTASALAALADRGLVDRTHRGWSVSAAVEGAVAGSLIRSDRRSLHRRAAGAIEAEGLFSVAAAALARHWSEAGEAARAVEPALLASEYAQRRFSFDEAADLLALASAGAAPERAAAIAEERGRHLTAAGRLDDAMATFAAAADIAHDTGDVETQARAAVGYEDALFASRRIRGGDDDRSTALLERALAARRDDASPLTARTLGALARAMAYRLDPRAREESDRAVDLARRCGDPAVHAYAIIGWRAAREGPEWLQDRRRLATEMVAAATAAQDDTQTIEVQRLSLVDHLQAGDVASADLAIEDLTSRIATLRRADHAWYPPMWRALRRLWAGDLAGAETAIGEFRATGRRVGYAAVDQVYAFQLYLLRRRQDRSAELLPLFARLTETVGDRWRAFDAGLAATVGDIERAERIIATLDLERSLPAGLAFAPAVAVFTDAVEATRARGLAEELITRLMPWRGQFGIMGAGAASTGPVDFTLGRLARITGDVTSARAHFTSARDLAASSLAPLDEVDARTALTAST